MYCGEIFCINFIDCYFISESNRYGRWTHWTEWRCTEDCGPNVKAARHRDVSNGIFYYDIHPINTQQGTTWGRKADIPSTHNRGQHGVERPLIRENVRWSQNYRLFTADRLYCILYFATKYVIIKFVWKTLAITGFFRSPNMLYLKYQEIQMHLSLTGTLSDKVHNINISVYIHYLTTVLLKKKNSSSAHILIYCKQGCSHIHTKKSGPVDICIYNCYEGLGLYTKILNTMHNIKHTHINKGIGKISYIPHVQLISNITQYQLYMYAINSNNRMNNTYNMYINFEFNSIVWPSTLGCPWFIIIYIWIQPL